MLTGDFNSDGFTDLLLAGNDSGFDVETGPVNTSPGFLLAGDGKGGFKAVSPSKSGFWAKGEVRTMKQISIKKHGQQAFIIGKNGGPVQVFLMKNQGK